MMVAVFQYLLCLSAALILVLLLRPLVKRLCGVASVYAMWWLVPLLPLAAAMPRPAAAPVVEAMAWTFHVQGTAPVIADTAPQPAGVDPRWWLAVWALGAVLSAALFFWQQRRFVRSLGALRAGPEDGVLTASTACEGPAVVGWWRARIVVPSDFAQRYSAHEQALILAHERVHVQRGDMLANALCCLLQVLVWFHPLLHWAARCFRLDQELACDAAVLRAHPQARRAYAEVILKTQLASHGAPVACTWQSRHPLKGRIMSLNAAPQPTWIRRAGQLGLAGLALGACLSAWAMQKEAPGAQPVVAKPVATPAAPKASAAPAQPAAKAPVAKAAVPATPAPAAPAPLAPEAKADAAARGVFNVVATYGLANGAEKTITMKGIGSDGATIQSLSDVKGGCDDEWTVRQNGPETVMFAGVVHCDGKLVSKPRLVIQIGQTGTLEITGDEDKLRFRLKVLVTRA